MSDTVDFFRENERATWKAFIARGDSETLQAWMRAFRNLNDELNARVDALLRGARVQTSGKGEVAP